MQLVGGFDVARAGHFQLMQRRENGLDGWVP